MKFAKPKNAKSAFLRLIKYFRGYAAILVVVAICIIIAAEANVYGTAQLKTIIDDHLTPMVEVVKDGSLTEEAKSAEIDVRWRSFALAIAVMAAVYLIGAVCIFIHSRLMIRVSTGVLLDIRKDMFKRMEKLPLKYFDSHTHGEIMSRYTNDIDSMREMVGQSIPQLMNSIFRVVSVFVMMIILSPVLTVITVIMLVLMILVVKTLGKRSGAFYKKRQAALGRANGYIEEMTEGQKVVKVFCREDRINGEFARLNDELRVSEAGANTWASILMPIMGNLSYIQYAITALLGTMMAVAAISGNYPALISLTIGQLITFLQYTRNFAQPITMMSQ